MDIRDLLVLKELFDKYENGTKLTAKEEIVKDKIETLLAFEDYNKEYQDRRQEFQKHMEELNKKAGE